MNGFRNWLRQSIDELDRLYDHPQPHEGVWQRAAAIVHEAGSRAAQLGFAALHARSTEFAGMADVQPAKTYLAGCLGAVPTERVDFPPLLTVDDAIAYLRLDVDERDPRERLRNLVRRQRLPCIRRGKLILFRRESVDAWTAARK